MFKCHISNFKTPRDNRGMSLPTYPVIKEEKKNYLAKCQFFFFFKFPNDAHFHVFFWSGTFEYLKKQNY